MSNQMFSVMCMVGVLMSSAIFGSSHDTILCAIALCCIIAFL